MKKIYAKTAKATRELEVGNRTLSLRHRQMLIIADGIKSQESLMKIFVKVDAEQMLKDLEKLGYLVDINAPKQANQTDNGIQPEKYKNDDPLENLTYEHLQFIKGFLQENLRTHAGLLARDLEIKIGMMQSGAQLKPYISRWHMTLRESRIGTAMCDQLMQKLYHLIANPPSDTGPKLAS